MDSTVGRVEADGIPPLSLAAWRRAHHIDKAGRLVIPKALRDQAGINAGAVEVFVDGAAIRIQPVTADEPVEVDGLLLLPAGGPARDADAVRQLRFTDQLPSGS